MSYRQYIVVVILALVVGMVLTVPVQARGDKEQAASEQQALSLDQAVSRVQKQSAGRVLAADAKAAKGGTVYRIKVLMPSGHVRIYHVDAKSGKIE